ncbi:MAG: serine protease AprX, partial [Actinomycetota bacterium]|nr:serine protease AprX [Actinomycetota bacterium]
QQGVEVIVRQIVGTDDAERSVQRVGGTVIQRLGVVDGFVARIPADKVAELSGAPGVQSVTANGHVQLFGSVGTAVATDGTSALGHVRGVVGVTSSTDASASGSGVSVALVDTGVADVAGINQLNRGPAVGGGTSLDGWGHGTHLAGIIGGNDGGSAPEFQGLANGTRVVSVKAAADDGSTNLATVLASMDWVLSQKSALNIRVVNLSLGVTPQADYRKDILSVAVERLWKAGIVVVVAAGNNGQQAGSPLTSPATDPYVIAVGALNTKGTDSRDDDVIPPFSPRGTDARRVDVVAPGSSVVSLLAPGSNAANYPAAFVGTRFIKGTGTSQSAAVVSGVVADLLQARPSLTPDQVKSVLARSTLSVSGGDVGQGAGVVNLARALTRTLSNNYTQTWDPATGTPGTPPPAPIAPPPPGQNTPGVWDFAHNGPPTPPNLDGTDPTGGWNGGTWSADGATFTGGTWSGGTWSSDGTSWSGGTWSGGTWSGGTWSGGTWSGGTWSGGTWSGGTWSGGTWSGGTWSGGTWSGGTWSGGTWSGGTWSGGTWSGGTWSGGSWSGGAWSGDAWTGTTWS